MANERTKDPAAVALGIGLVRRLQTVVLSDVRAKKDTGHDKYEATWNAIIETHGSVEGLRESMIQLRISAESLVEATRNSVEETKALRGVLGEQTCAWLEDGKALRAKIDQQIEESKTWRTDQTLRDQVTRQHHQELLGAMRDLIDRIPPENLARKPDKQA